MKGGLSEAASPLPWLPGGGGGSVGPGGEGGAVDEADGVREAGVGLVGGAGEACGGDDDGVVAVVEVAVDAVDGLYDGGANVVAGLVVFALDEDAAAVVEVDEDVGAAVVGAADAVGGVDSGVFRGRVRRWRVRSRLGSCGGSSGGFGSRRRAGGCGVGWCGPGPARV